MKKIFLIVLLMMTVLMYGCGNSNSSSNSSNSSNSTTATSNTNKASDTNSTSDTVTTSNAKYTIEKAIYKDKNIQINYPQISNLGDSDKQKKINEIIKTEALSGLNDYKENIANLTFNLNYEIKYKGSDFLSIVYLGTTYVTNGMHPNNVIQTTNIDLVKTNSIMLSEIAQSASEKFSSKILAGKYKPYSSDLNLEDGGNLKSILDGFDSSSLMLMLKQNTAKFYLTKDSLGVSIETMHAAGDHFEMEVDYKSLGDLLSIKPKGSEDLTGSH